MTPAPEILFEARGGVGFVRLNRPKALNALSLTLIVAFDAQLEHYPILRGHLTGLFCPVVRSASKCTAGHRIRSATRPRDKRTRPSAKFELGGQSGSSAALRRLPAIWDSGAPHRAARRACPPHCPNEPLWPIK